MSRVGGGGGLLSVGLLSVGLLAMPATHIHNA
jgi:hypothetical protein